MRSDGGSGSFPPSKELHQKTLGKAEHDGKTFELRVVCFGDDDQPRIGWIWRIDQLSSEDMKIGYLAGFDRPRLEFRTHGNLPVDRALTWPQEDDRTMFDRFRELWQAAGYKGRPTESWSVRGRD